MHDIIAAAGEARSTPGASDSGGEFAGVNQLGAGRLLGSCTASAAVQLAVELEANLGATPFGDVALAGPPLVPAGGRVQPALARALEVAFAVGLGEDATRVAEVGELLSLDAAGERGWILTRRACDGEGAGAGVGFVRGEGAGAGGAGGSGGPPEAGGSASAGGSARGPGGSAGASSFFALVNEGVAGQAGDGGASDKEQAGEGRDSTHGQKPPERLSPESVPAVPRPTRGERVDAERWVSGSEKSR